MPCITIARIDHQVVQLKLRIWRSIDHRETKLLQIKQEDHKDSTTTGQRRKKGDTSTRKDKTKTKTTKTRQDQHKIRRQDKTKTRQDQHKTSTTNE
jgi:hypothetical protein